MSWRFLGVAIAAWAAQGCGLTARSAGRQATEGAIAAVKEELPDVPGEPPTEELAGRFVGGAIEELATPERLEQLERVLRTASAASISGAVSGVGGAGGGGPGPGGTSAFERLAGQAAEGASAEVIDQLTRALGEGGPLSAALADSSRRISAAAVAGAREQFPLFEECQGPQSARCLERRLEALGQAASTGFMRGLRQSLFWPALIVTFLLGVLAALVVGWAWTLYRAHRVRPPQRPPPAHPRPAQVS